LINSRLLEPLPEPLPEPLVLPLLLPLERRDLEPEVLVAIV
jgi:hypothetical protein